MRTTTRRSADAKKDTSTARYTRAKAEKLMPQPVVKALIAALAIVPLPLTASNANA